MKSYGREREVSTGNIEIDHVRNFIFIKGTEEYVSKIEKYLLILLSGPCNLSSKRSK